MNSGTRIAVILGVMMVASMSRAEPWTPAYIQSSIALWVDASDASTLWADAGGTVAATNGGVVLRWNDKSGKGYNLTGNPGFSRKPNYRTNFNGKPALVCSPAGLTNGYNLGISANADRSLFAVLWPEVNKISNPFFGVTVTNCADFGTYTSANRLRLRNNATNLYTAAGSVPCGDWQMFGIYGRSAETYAWLNGSSILSTGTTWFAYAISTKFKVPYEEYWTSDTNRVFNGGVAEVVLVTGTLEIETRQKVEGYLAWKWDLESKLPVGHPYKSSPPSLPAGTIISVK